MIYDILHEKNCHFSLFLLFPIHAQGLNAVVVFDYMVSLWVVYSVLRQDHFRAVSDFNGRL